MDDFTDLELIAAYRGGNQSALPNLVVRHLSSVAAFCFQLMLDRTQADDLVQETFLRAIRSLHTFRGASQFQTWLFTIAANLAKSQLARGKRESTLDLGPDTLPAPAEQAPDCAAMRSELEHEIELALAELPLQLRSTLMMATVHGTSPQEIADTEGCSLNTIYWRIHEARKILKRRLQQWTS